MSRGILEVESMGIETLVIIYWLSFAALNLTKVADVVSTIRWVSLTAETNPWALGHGVFFGVCIEWLT